MVMSVPRVLCIGDIVSGAFVNLSEDYADVTTDDKGYKRLSFELGAKLPYKGIEEVKAVECAPNAAVSMSRLGLNVSLMAWLGDDKVGQEMADYLKSEGVDTDNLVVEAGKRSNYHLYLKYGADRTKLQKFEDYSYQWREPSVKPDWIYLGVLGEKTWPLHEALLAYLDANPDVQLAFQPGMYHLMWGTEKMAPFYKKAAIVVLNREEAVQVTGKEHGDMAGLIQGLHALGVKLAVITDGPEGAYASDGQKTLFMPIYPDPKPPYDRTGAGDAFASTLTAALALGESMEMALAWAPINSMNVSQYLGAQKGLLTKEQLEAYLKDAPQDYKSKPF
jgi:ribokinase